MTEVSEAMVEAAAEALRKDFGDFSYSGRLRMASTALSAALKAQPQGEATSADEALERAAQIADKAGACEDIAAAIRNLKQGSAGHG